MHTTTMYSMHVTIQSLPHAHMLPITHKQLHNYSLTRCVCPRKGAVQEKKTKECKMTNTS